MRLGVAGWAEGTYCAAEGVLGPHAARPPVEITGDQGSESPPDNSRWFQWMQPPGESQIAPHDVPVCVPLFRLCFVTAEVLVGIVGIK